MSCKRHDFHDISLGTFPILYGYIVDCQCERASGLLPTYPVLLLAPAVSLNSTDSSVSGWPHVQYDTTGRDKTV